MRKKVLLTILAMSALAILNINEANAYSGKFKYSDQGGIFTNTAMPVDIAKAENGETDLDLKKLKSGESTSRNILYIVEVGDASIEEAARKASITKVKYVDTKTCKVFIPLGIIPILVRETKTIVYGE